MDNKEMARAIKEAFFEGYDSYETPAVSYLSAEKAWEGSAAKELHDKLISH